MTCDGRKTLFALAGADAAGDSPGVGTEGGGRLLAWKGVPGFAAVPVRWRWDMAGRILEIRFAFPAGEYVRAVGDAPFDLRGPLAQSGCASITSLAEFEFAPGAGPPSRGGIARPPCAAGSSGIRNIRRRTRWSS